MSCSGVWAWLGLTLLICVDGTLSESRCDWHWNGWSTCNASCGESGTQNRTASGCGAPDTETRTCYRYCSDRANPQPTSCSCPDEFLDTCSCCDNYCTPIANCEHLICTNMTNQQCNRCEYDRGAEIKAYHQVNAEGYPNRVCEQRCSWRPDSKFCYPGSCPNIPSNCTCAPGFGGNNCLTISSLPSIMHCLAKLMRVVNGTEKDTTEAECRGVTAPSTVFVGRHIAYNRLQMTWDSSWIGPSAGDWPRPYYINDFKVGIISANSSWRLLRVSSETYADSSRQISILAWRKAAVPRIEFKVQANNGGYVVINNYDRSDGVVTQNPRLHYRGTEVIHTAHFTYDLIDPVHCSVAGNCSSKPVEIGPPFTKNGQIQMRWSGWSDEGSGLGLYEYEVYKLQPYGDVLGMRSVTPFATGSLNASEGAGMVEVTLDVPGTYCFFLTVDDVAGNYQRARRFLIYDDVNNVTVDAHYPLWADSAGANTSHLWQTDLQDSLGTGTKGQIQMRWSGWSDEGSGLGLYEYEVYKLQPYGDVLGLRSVTPFATGSLNASEGAGMVEVTLDDPGTYCFFLTVDDVAGNYQRARRFLIYDDVNNVTVDTLYPLWADSAAANTSHLWQTDLQDSLGTGTKVSLKWPGRYRNLFHDQHKLLAAIEQYDPPIPEGYEEVNGLPPEERSLQAIPNIYGITKIETAFAVDHAGGLTITTPPNNWTMLHDVTVERVDLDIPRRDGDSIRLWVQAYDVIGNFVREEVIVHVDSSPPVVENFWLNRHGVPSLAVHHSSDLFTMRFEFDAFDDHSGLHSIRWKLQDFLNGSTVHGEGQVAVRRPSALYPECDPPHCTCIPKDNECYFRNYEIVPDLNKMDIPVGSHDHDYVFVVTATNNAMLMTTVTFQDALPGQRDLDFQQDLQLHAWWDGFFDRESGVQFYKYAFANRCLGKDEFGIPRPQHVHNTTDKFGTWAAPIAGTYFCTVVAYNPALTPSSPVCSDGITVDISPPSVRHIKISGFRARPGMVIDSEEKVWIVDENGEREIVIDPPESCRNASRRVDDIELLPIAEPPYGRNTTSLNCTQLGPLPEVGYLPVENHLHIQWDGWDDESGIADYEVGLASTRSASVSPDIHTFVSTKSHTELILHHPNLAQGALFYIVIRATNRALLSTLKVFGPITVDVTPPVIETSVNVTHATSNNEDFLVATWSEGSIYDPEDPAKLELEAAVGHLSGSAELFTFSPVESSTLCPTTTPPSCVSLPVSNFEWHLHGNHVYYVTVRVTNSAGLTSSVTSMPYHHNVELPSVGVVFELAESSATDALQNPPDIDHQTSQSEIRCRWFGFAHAYQDISYLAGVGSAPGLDDVVPLEFVGSSTSHVFTGLNLAHFQITATVNLPNRLDFTTCIKLLLRGKNKAGLYSVTSREINDCDDPGSISVRYPVVFDAVPDFNATLAVHSGISLSTNEFWTVPDEDFTRSEDTLSAVWPALRHGHYYWKVLSGDAIERWSYHRHENELNYHSFRCDEPESLKCGQTKENFVNVRGLELQNGHRYYVCIFAEETLVYEKFEHVAEEVSVCSNGVVVDHDQPVPGEVHIGWGNEKYRTSTTELPIIWESFRDVEVHGNTGHHHTGVMKYEYAIGTSPGLMDVRQYVDAGLTNHAVARGLLLQSGHTYYVTVRATDHVGLQTIATSAGITIDTTPHSITDTRIDVGGRYLMSKDIVSVNWEGLFFDLQSGVKQYAWCIGSQPGHDDVIPYLDVGPEEQASSDPGSSLGLHEGHTYFVTIKHDLSTVTVTWGGFSEPHTDILEYSWMIGTCSGCDDVMEEQHVGLMTHFTKQAFASGLDTPLPLGIPLFVTVRAYNNAGLWAERSSNGFIVDNSPPSVVTDPKIDSTAGSVITGTQVDSSPPTVGTFAVATDHVVDLGRPVDGEMTYWQTDGSIGPHLRLAWLGFADPHSGIDHYLVTVGTSYSGSDLTPAGPIRINHTTTYGSSTEGQVQLGTVPVGRDLVPGEMIYISVWAVNAVLSPCYVDRYEWSAGLAGEAVGSHVFDTSTDRIWHDVGKRTSAILTLPKDGTYASLQSRVTYVWYVRAWYNENDFAIFTSDGVKSLPLPPQVSTSRKMKDLQTLSATKDKDFTTSQTMIAVSWNNVFPDPFEEINNYQVALGTSPGACDVVTWGVVTTPDVTRASLENLSLQTGATYYSSVRVTNHAGLHTTVTSDGIKVDTIAPAAGTVYDGFGLHDADYQNDSLTVWATWHGFSDLESYIHHYIWCVGSSPGAEDILPCRDVGVALSASEKLDQSLISGTKYYSTVTAVDAAGLRSSPVSSNGISVDSTPPVAVEMLTFGPNLVNDPSFEQTSSSPGPSSEWNVTGTVQALNLSRFAKDEQTWIHLQGSISQKVKTQSGEKYQLIFHARHVDKTGLALQSQEGKVTAPGLHKTFKLYQRFGTFDHSDLTDGTVANWHQHIYYFTATSSESEILFSSVGRSGLGLDQISVRLVNTTAREATGIGSTLGLVHVHTSTAADWHIVQASWDLEDLESSIVKYEWAIGTVQGGTQLQSFTSVARRTSARNEDLRLQHGSTIHVTVVATNAAELKTVVHSDAIMVDLTPPVISKIKDGFEGDDVDYQSNLTLTASWEVKDEETGVSRCEWAQGLNPGSTEISHFQPTKYMSSSSKNLTGQIHHGQTIYTTVRCYNHAGLEAQAVTDGVTLVTNPPDSTAARLRVAPVSQTLFPAEEKYQNVDEELRFFWEGFRDEAGIDHYEGSQQGWAGQRCCLDKCDRRDGPATG
uniref:EGF-like domain-containing protein n=1 Tax=Branchiostoma floridae TaxID=7739 RepID=C3Y4M3_BRAFL|eukprot:XP_002608670.1 hypothetical protein BRAFLDRAFT_73893 [Branchiostoma floridae]